MDEGKLLEGKKAGQRPEYRLVCNGAATPGPRTTDPLNSIADSVSIDGSQFTSKPVEAHGIELASTTKHSKSPGDLNAVGNQDLPEHLQCMLPEENSLNESEMQRVKHLIREFDEILGSSHRTSPGKKMEPHGSALISVD